MLNCWIVSSFCYQIDGLHTCDVMAAMLVDRNNKIFLLWEFTSIFMQTL